MRITVASVSDGRRRHLQPLERLAPLLARDGIDAERVQVVGEEHGGRLAQPEDAAVARDVLERHHEDAAGRLSAGGARTTRGDGRESDDDAPDPRHAFSLRAGDAVQHGDL